MTRAVRNQVQQENRMHRSIRLFTVSFVMCVLSAITAPPINAKGKNITIDKNDQKTTVACTDNAVTVTSEDNNITPSGECPQGHGQRQRQQRHHVIVANVGKITVTGNDVNVVGTNGIGGKPPKISQKKGNDINIVHNGK